MSKEQLARHLRDLAGTITVLCTAAQNADLQRVAAYLAQAKLDVSRAARALYEGRP